MSDGEEISHGALHKAIGALEQQADAHAVDFETLANAVHEHHALQETRYKEAEPFRLFIEHLYTVGRIGNFVRSAVGWSVLIVGGGLMIFDYVLGMVG